jgi:hypothetical protein
MLAAPSRCRVVQQSNCTLIVSVTTIGCSCSPCRPPLSRPISEDLRSHSAMHDNPSCLIPASHVDAATVLCSVDDQSTAPPCSTVTAPVVAAWRVSTHPRDQRHSTLQTFAFPYVRHVTASTQVSQHPQRCVPVWLSRLLAVPPQHAHCVRNVVCCLPGVVETRPAQRSVSRLLSSDPHCKADEQTQAATAPPRACAQHTFSAEQRSHPFCERVTRCFVPRHIHTQNHLRPPMRRISKQDATMSTSRLAASASLAATMPSST